jgi:hypothetical protein
MGIPLQVTSSNLTPLLQSLSDKAKASFNNGEAFNVSVPSQTGTGAEQLSGNFQYEMIEPAGDNSLFTPGDPTAFNAGQQAFSDALQNFLMLAEESGKQATGSSSSAPVADFHTATSFEGNGVAMSWSGTFSLGPVGTGSASS